MRISLLQNAMRIARASYLYGCRRIQGFLLMQYYSQLMSQNPTNCITETATSCSPGPFGKGFYLRDFFRTIADYAVYPSYQTAFLKLLVPQSCQL
jgi:hypothetical protein